MQLYQAQRHEPPSAAQWDEARVRAAIEAIVTDTHRAFSDEGLWPIHPLDRSPERPPDSLKTMFNGAAGVIWALNHLNQSGAAALNRDYLATVRELARRHRDDLRKYESVREYLGLEIGSYLMGEAGFLLLHFKLEPSEDLADQLHATIEARIGDPRGLVWGGAGSMLAALFLYERTKKGRWKDLFIRHFDALWDQWEYDAELRCHLWNCELYGITENRLGALHGFVANAFPMIRGRHLTQVIGLRKR